MAVSVACLVSTLFILFSVVVGLQSRLLRLVRTDSNQTSSTSTGSSSEPEDQPVRYFDAPRLRGGLRRSEKPVDAVNYTLYPQDVYTSGMRCFCVLNGDQVNKTRHGVVYNLYTFPYHLCTDVAYSSVQLESDGRKVVLGVPSTLEFNAFSELKDRNPYVKAWLFVSDSDPPALEMLIKYGKESWEWFVSNAVHFMRQREYDALAVTWSGTFAESDSVAFFRYVRDALRPAELSLAVIISLEDAYVESGVFRSVVETLEDDSIIIRPSFRKAQSVSATFLTYTPEIVQRFRKLQAYVTSVGRKKHPGSNYRACLLLTLAGTGLVLSDSSDSGVKSRAVGPWTGGSVGYPGQIALEDVCRKTWDATRTEHYALVATKGILWTATHSLETLRRLLDALMNDTEGGRLCVGVEDPEWDDISGFCPGSRQYPLTRLIFSSALTHTVRNMMSQQARLEGLVSG